MDIGKIEDEISHAIAQLERAKLRLVMAIDICYEERVDKKKVHLELISAHNELRKAGYGTTIVITQLESFLRANEETTGLSSPSST